MKHVVEIAHLVNGEPLSVRILSAARERLAVGAAVGRALLLCLGAMIVAAAVAQAAHRVLFAPGFLFIWISVGIAVSALVASRVGRRRRRYQIGARLDADAFAPVEVDLVRRRGDRFEITIVPGMTGQIHAGRSSLPVEALVPGSRRTLLTLDPGAAASIALGTSMFAVRSRPDGGEVRLFPVRQHLSPLSRSVVVGLQIALVGSLFCAVPAGRLIGSEVRHTGFRATTPWEAEKVLRAEAQAQAGSFHQCFDPLPITCQRPGYVGVGLSLTRDGEIRSRWIARSTYSGADCPVDDCMKEVISTWSFDPLPEPMRVVLPVQVLRTNKPLPTNLAVAPVEKQDFEVRTR